MRTLILLLAVLLTLAGCGFHLRGHAQLPAGLPSIYINAPRVVGEELSESLRAGGARVGATRADAEAELAVSGERFDRRTLSVDPNTGTAREFELAYSASFRLTGKDGRALMPVQSVRLVRDYGYDPTVLIGKSREESILMDEMRRDAAQQILRRLQSTGQGDR